MLLRNVEVCQKMLKKKIPKFPKCSLFGLATAQGLVNAGPAHQHD